jgi:hypothetical protein
MNEDDLRELVEEAAEEFEQDFNRAARSEDRDAETDRPPAAARMEVGE